MNNAVKLLRDQVKDAHGWLEATMVGAEEKHLSVTPPGTANPLGATYAHAVLSEDGIVAGMLQNKMPLLATTYKSKLGVNKPMPMPGPEWAHYNDWTHSVEVDMPKFREYAQAVYIATDEYLASLNDKDLENPVDMTQVGLGQKTLAWALSTLLVGHIHDMTGEISVLKGIQGLKGYPM